MDFFNGGSIIMDYGHHNSNILNVKDLNDGFIYLFYLKHCRESIREQVI